MMNDGGKNKKTALVGVSNSLFLVAVVVAMAIGVNGNAAGGGDVGSGVDSKAAGGGGDVGGGVDSKAAGGGGDVGGGVDSKAAAGGGGVDSKAAAGGAAENIPTPNKEIKELCQPTDYPETCEKVLAKAGVKSSDPQELIKAGFKYIVDEIKIAIVNSTAMKESAKDPRAKKALEDCGELMDYAIDDLLLSFNRATDNFEINKMDDYIEDIKIWLSGALTYQETCIDGFENVTSKAGKKMGKLLKKSKQMTANVLDIVGGITSIKKALGNFELPSFGRRLLEEESDEEGEPSWVTERRELLQATPKNIKADAVVAMDGSGQYKTITQALQAIPLKGNKTFVIHIKAGVYKEQVMVDKKMTHVMMIGDGPTKTKITGSENFVDGTPTFKTATVSIIGSNFIAKDIGFENTAGAVKHQAVALRVQSDMSIFYNCQMDGYQDTLYTQTHRQFYRDCTITGTIDFIFGNAAVVFQNCKIFVRKPMDNQKCIVTAQGRLQKKEPTGIVLQNCAISSGPDFFPVRQNFEAYLGRPWKEYSRTIIMQSQIDDLIRPEGWLPWEGNFALNTLFYAEINNRGPGSAKDKRVKWRGIKQVTPQHALDFTAGLFIRGNPWIQPTGVPYDSGMMKV